MSVIAGRHTATPPDEFVVFLIGMRVNRLWAIRSWTSVAAAMSPMLAELSRQPELGLRHAQMRIGWRTIETVQYWESFEKLERFARAREHSHLPAWREFNRRAYATEGVGIYHETYVVRRGSFEGIYVNMPVFGLARAFGHAPVATRGQAAGRRLGLRAEDEPALPAP